MLDATGLEGSFDFTLSFSPAGLFQSGGGPSKEGAQPTSGAPTASDPNGALSLFDAVSKQLGLKLEPTKGPRDFLVIDHVEKPSGN